MWINDKDRSKPFVFLYAAIGSLVLIIICSIWNAFSVLGLLGI